MLHFILLVFFCFYDGRGARLARDVIARREVRTHELPTKGAWDRATQKLAREQLGRCIRPDLSVNDLTWLGEFRAAVKAKVEFTIEDCGEARATGEWVRMGTHSGHARYAKNDDEHVMIEYSDSRGAWRMFINNSLGFHRKTLYQVEAEPDVSRGLPLSGWSVVDGSLPIPRLLGDDQQVDDHLTPRSDAVQFSIVHCGMQRVIGDYVYTGKHSDRPHYVKVDDASVQIEYSNSREAWRLFVDNGVGFNRKTLYFKPSPSDDTLAFPAEGWEVESGSLPLPVFNLKAVVHDFSVTPSHPQSHSRALQNAAGAVLPSHRAVVYTSQRRTIVPKGRFFPDSQCYHFDYDAPAGTVPDPHGCWLFRRSFSRLKTLRQCVVGKLDASIFWQRYRRAADFMRNITQGSPVDTPDTATLRALKACKKKKKCKPYDTVMRADEMVKFVSFHPWSSVGHEFREWLKKKVRLTKSFQSETASLEESVVEDIIGDCFHADVDSYMQLSGEAKVLERSLPCNMIMWDSAEVPALPIAPMRNAASMWDPKLSSKHKASTMFAFPDTPVGCGRAAGILAGWPQVQAKKGYSVLTIGIAEDNSWSSCISPSTFNCIYHEKCWRTALRLACDLTSDRACCGDVVGTF